MGLPGVSGRYSILHSCIAELERTGIISSPDLIAEFKTLEIMRCKSCYSSLEIIDFQDSLSQRRQRAAWLSSKLPSMYSKLRYSAAIVTIRKGNARASAAVRSGRCPSLPSLAVHLFAIHASVDMSVRYIQAPSMPLDDYLEALRQTVEKERQDRTNFASA